MKIYVTDEMKEKDERESDTKKNINNSYNTFFAKEVKSEQQSSSQKSLEGIALKETVHVYKSTSRDSRNILKSYQQGHKLKYQNYSANWYIANVNINGTWQTGYIYKDDVENAVEHQQTLYGISKRTNTYVYSKASKNSKVLRSYPIGAVLKYKTFTSNWYEATVKVNGKWHTGYIFKDDVETQVQSPKTIQGVGIKNPTNVYQSASTSSKVVKAYKYGTVLKYKEFTSNWYQATVYLNGKPVTGYILKSDVDSLDKPLYGYAQKNHVTVYSDMSKSSKALKTYPIGARLKFRAYSRNWHKATVIINGKGQQGYIHTDDVDPVVPVIYGYANKEATAVYASRSKNSKKLKTYSKGSQLKYRYFNNNWYEATVIISGKKQKGYIHKNDVSETPPVLESYANRSSTRVYANTSRSSSVLKSYPKGSKLKYRPHNNNWYKATVYVKGKKKTGYIHKSDLTTKKPALRNVDRLKSVENNDQLILVTSKGYNTYRVKIETFERDATGDWKRVLSTNGFIGKNGFAAPGKKKEGDGKSPEGRYTIGIAFGQFVNPGTKLNYRRITSDDVWVDDPTSKLYNTWQSKKKTKGQWKSAENMNHPLYKYGFVINYNTKRTPYKGSAIFFHVANNYTVGCTGTSESNVIAILKWLDPKKNPVIIQTPESELNKY